MQAKPLFDAVTRCYRSHYGAQQVSRAMVAAAHIRMQRKTGSLKRKVAFFLEGEQNKKNKNRKDRKE